MTNTQGPDSFDDVVIGPHCPPELKKRIKANSNPLELFVVEETIAESSRATVFRASLKFDAFSDVAIKRIEATEFHRKFLREVNIHSRLSHEHIVQFYCAFMAADGCIYIILEYCGRGDLFSLIRDAGGLSEPDAVTNVIKPLLSALDYLHGLEVVHRDIKPENLLVGDAGTVKLADFGLAVDLSVERASSFAGTKPFIAPEILLEPEQRDQLDAGLQPESASLNMLRQRLGPGVKAAQPSTTSSEHAVTLRADIWSLGVLAYESRTARIPFKELYGDGKYFPKNVTAEEIAKEVGKLDRSRLSIDYWDFVQLCFTVNPTSRASATELLNHCLLRRIQHQSKLMSLGGRDSNPNMHPRGGKIIGERSAHSPTLEPRPTPLLSGLALRSMQPQLSPSTQPSPSPQPGWSPQVAVGTVSAKDAKEAETQKRKVSPFASCPDRPGPAAPPSEGGPPKRTSPPAEVLASLRLADTPEELPDPRKKSSFQAFKQRIVNTVAGKKRG